MKWKSCIREFGSDAHRPNFLERLENRALIELRGAETVDFLQGLITNDMHHFTEGIPNIFALFLNTKGRVLWDAMVYRSPEATYLLEVDSRVTQDVERHLKMYRLRKKIDIGPPAKMRVWAAYDANSANGAAGGKSKFEGRIFPCGSLTNTSSKFMDHVMIFRDPRMPHAGLRVLTRDNVDRDAVAKQLDLEARGELSYREFRYRLGIAEGVDDLPPGKPLPLEVNCDYLHGVSFHKGCYIGQELTARTHHTGVVRKRLMPLVFAQLPQKTPNYDDNIVDEAGKPVGKFRGVEGKFGIGLMRVSEALAAGRLQLGSQDVRVVKPNWWPVESPKEKMSIN